jgi:phosphoribosyl-ATP pyrophosphohydrolase/phosphoribosyl-AMP cyclohydrolase
MKILTTLYSIIENRKEAMPKGSYVASLFREGDDRIAQKVGEEAVELVIDATKNDRQRIIEETSDLLFHLLVLLKAKNISVNQIEETLKKRHSKSD